MNWLHRRYCRSDHWRLRLERLVPWALDDVRLGDHVLEIGPGTGVTTAWLCGRTSNVTTLDRDPAAVAAQRRLARPGVSVVHGDAARLPFRDATFTATVAFVMLHHVSPAASQDRVFREVSRVLRPGGVFVGVDAAASVLLRLAHWWDTYTPVPPRDLARRLSDAGFGDVAVAERQGYFRFRARAPRGGAPDERGMTW